MEKKYEKHIRFHQVRINLRQNSKVAHMANVIKLITTKSSQYKILFILNNLELQCEKFEHSDEFFSFTTLNLRLYCPLVSEVAEQPDAS